MSTAERGEATMRVQDERPFISCKKVMMDMGAPYNQHELVSFHTISKGALGECGIRGGMLEAINIHPGTIEQLYKIASINLSPNTSGQARAFLPGPYMSVPSASCSSKNTITVLHAGDRPLHLICTM